MFDSFGLAGAVFANVLFAILEDVAAIFAFFDGISITNRGFVVAAFVRRNDIGAEAVGTRLVVVAFMSAFPAVVRIRELVDACVAAFDLFPFAFVGGILDAFAVKA